MNTKHLAELARAATPGPISVIDGYYPSFKELSGLSFKVSVVMWAADLTEADYLKRDADLNYMAAAYNALPELLAANEALTAENAELRADAERWRKYKARKDAVIAAHMGRNPLRHDEAIDAAIAARSATP